MIRRTYNVRAQRHTLALGSRTLIMAIVNVTPDSFSQDGLLKNQKKPSFIRHALNLVQAGADIIDVGGESTRPGAKPVTVTEEIRRVVPFIQGISTQCQIPISIDTYKPEVAIEALKAGASIVNNIQGAKPDKALLKAVKDHDAAIVLMHMRGTPQTMQGKTRYKDLIGEMIKEMRIGLEKCLEIGIKKDRIILDPGIGFAKTAEQNFQILNSLEKFHTLRCPLLVGTSRKSFIGKLLNKDSDQRVMGTSATVAASILKGAHIIRVHDVAPMKDVAVVTDAILNAHF